MLSVLISSSISCLSISKARRPGFTRVRSRPMKYAKADPRIANSRRIATHQELEPTTTSTSYSSSTSAVSNHVGSSECAVLRQEKDWYGRIPVARSKIDCEVIKYEPVLTGCSYRGRPLQERQRPHQGQRQTPLSHATRDPPLQGAHKRQFFVLKCLTTNNSAGLRARPHRWPRQILRR